MTSPVSSYSQAPGLPDPIGSAGTAPAGPPLGEAPSVTSAGSPPGAAAPSGEAVTLTPDAQTSADLLEAARAAAGLDHQAVQGLKAEIMSGTYEGPAENLAASIVAALTETQS
jgi:anti-sigma28 factor (negative regulator of flagellin synthesis)